jgi:MFS family permease
MAFIYSGVYFYAFTLFVTPIRDELPRLGSQISPAFLVTGVTGAILAPILGGIFDRWGPKLVVSGGMLAGGLGFVLMGLMTEPWHLYLGLTLAGVGPIAIWGGAIPAVANWFIRLRGRALGLTTMGLGLGGLLVNPTLTLIDAVGWRMSFFLMGAAIWVLLMPLAFILRRRPEDYGLLPDGDDPDASSVGASGTEIIEEGMSFRQVMRSPVFWLIALFFSLAFWPIGGLQVHMAPYLEGTGFSRAAAATTVGAMAVITIVGRLGGGWLADTIDPRKATILALALQAIGIGIFALVSPNLIWLLLLFLIAFAPGFGGITVLQPALIGIYFGRRAFGAIQGVLWTATSLSFSLAPLVLGWLATLLGDFRPGFGVFALLSIIGAVLVLALPRPGIVSSSSDG